MIAVIYCHCLQCCRFKGFSDHDCVITFQDVKYDYTVDLTGSGDRSEFDTENY